MLNGSYGGGNLDLSICLVVVFATSSASVSESSESDKEKLTKVLRFGGAEVELFEMGVSWVVVVVEKGLLSSELIVESEKEENALGIWDGKEWWKGRA